MGLEIEKPNQRAENTEDDRARGRLSEEATNHKPFHQEQSNLTKSDTRVFNENNISAALKAATESNKPIISIVSKDGNLSAKDMAAIKAHGDDAIFVNINNDKALSLRTKGMNSADFWALANLSGAANDLNNIKPGLVAKFDPSQLKGANPERNLRSAIVAGGVDELFSGAPNAKVDGTVKPEVTRAADTKIQSAASDTERQSGAADTKRQSGAAGTKSFSEDNVLAAVEAAKSNGKPIVSFNVGTSGLSPESKAQIDAIKNDYNVVLINKQHASEKMSQGLENKEFWTLANLMGAKGDVNRIKDNYVGEFSNGDLKNAGSRSGFKASVESTDLKSILPQLVIENAAKKPERSSSPSDKPAPADQPAPSPKVIPVNFAGKPEGDPYKFNQGGGKAADKPAETTKVTKPSAPADPYEFNQGGKKQAKETGAEAKPNPTEKIGGNGASDKPAQVGKTAPKEKVERPDPSSKKQDVLPKPGAAESDKPAAKPANTNAAWLEQAADKPKDKPVEVEKKGVKLDNTRYDEHNFKEAYDLAKKNGLPLVVLAGAEGRCGPCRGVAPAYENITQNMNRVAQAGDAKAVVVKVDIDNARFASDPANAQLLRDLSSSISSIPHLAIYNPSKASGERLPAAENSSVIGGQSQSQIESFIANTIGAKGKLPGNVGAIGARQELPNLYAEKSVFKAAEYAQANNKPMISFVSDKANPNIEKALQYLNEQKLAAAVEVSKTSADQMFRAGLEPRHFGALKSAIGANNASSYINASSPEAIKSDMKFAPGKTAIPGSPEEMVKFLKDSGVNFSGKQERAVMALLEGKPVPEEKPANAYSAKTAKDAELVLKLAKERNLPVVVHATTQICTDTSCKMVKLPATTAGNFADKAIFLEVPPGGFPASDVNSPSLQAINSAFQAKENEHKTAVDMHVYQFNQAQNGAIEQMDRARLVKQSEVDYLESLLK